MRPDKLLSGLTLALALAACGDDDATTSTGEPSGSSSSSGEATTTGAGGAGGEGSSSSSDGSGAGTQVVPPTSPTALVKLRTGRRLEADIAQVLGIASSEVCNELGRYNCQAVHQVPLLEPDAFGAGLYEALPATTASTPLAVERLALSACDAAARRDLGAPSEAVIFRDLAVDESGRLEDVGADEVEAAIVTLARRALLREPEAWEVAVHRDLYDAIEAAPASVEPAREWATLSCFVTLTSLEFLFY